MKIEVKAEKTRGYSMISHSKKNILMTMIIISIVFCVCSCQSREDKLALREKSGIINLDMDTEGYYKFSVSILKEYGEDLVGEKVITSFVISDVESDSLKASDGSLTYGLICKFNSKEISKMFDEDEKVTVAGIVESVSISVPRLKDCIIIGYGEDIDTLEATKNTQKKYVELIKKEHAVLKSVETGKERDTYSKDCEIVDYNDVERNPDNYKGKKIKISGKVIQVSEGLFDSVTLRVEESDGNVWYVTYSREDGESRILEKDSITCYGECDGIETYTSILGDKISIPSMKMKYYEIKTGK